VKLCVLEDPKKNLQWMYLLGIGS